MNRLPLRGVRRFGAITVVILIGAVLLMEARDGIREDLVLNRLSLISSLRAGGILAELREARSDAVLWSGFGNVRQRLRELEDAWESMGPGGADRLRQLYSDGSPYPEGERHLLADAGDGSSYSRVHSGFHERIREFLTVHDYYDILLVDTDGRVLYSHHKEEDFASDLLRGEWSGTGAASVAREALVMDPGQAVFSDLAPYEPSEGQWALFLASPISLSDLPGDQGALVFQISARRLGLHLERGPGRSAGVESVLLGNGYRVLGRAPWVEEASGERSGVTEEVLRLAEEEGEGAAVLRDGPGDAVFVAWAPVSFEGLDWVVASSVAGAEIRAEGASEHRTIGIVALLVWLAAGTLTLGWRRDMPLGHHEI